jgi:hypothetical protein
MKVNLNPQQDQNRRGDQLADQFRAGTPTLYRSSHRPNRGKLQLLPLKKLQGFRTAKILAKEKRW